MSATAAWLFLRGILLLLLALAILVTRIRFIVRRAFALLTPLLRRELAWLRRRALSRALLTLVRRALSLLTSILGALLTLAWRSLTVLTLAAGSLLLLTRTLRLARALSFQLLIPLILCHVISLSQRPRTAAQSIRVQSMCHEIAATMEEKIGRATAAVDEEFHVSANRRTTGSRQETFTDF